MRSEVAAATRSQLILARRLESDVASGTTITTMVRAAARARLDLAYRFVEAGELLLRSGVSGNNVGMTRSSIGRFYYAMFQAARAIAFIEFGGDDKNGHQDLPRALPQSFPQRAFWVNELKNARVRRNDSDYDPYPTAHNDWVADAQSLEATAQSFVVAADTYLTQLGV